MIVIYCIHGYACILRMLIFKRFLHTYMTLVRRDRTIFSKSKGLYLLQWSQEKSSAKEDEITMPFIFVITIMVYLSFWPFVNSWEQFYTVCLLSAVTKLNKGSELLFDKKNSFHYGRIFFFFWCIIRVNLIKKRLFILWFLVKLTIDSLRRKSI